MPKLVKIQCPHCGAPVDVNTDAAHATCDFCGATSPVTHGPRRAGPATPSFVVHDITRIVVLIIVTAVLLVGAMVAVTCSVCGGLLCAMGPPPDPSIADAGHVAAQAPEVGSIPARVDFDTNESCICQLDVDGQPGPETIQLAVKADAQSHGGPGTELVTRFYLDIGEGSSWYLPVTDETAPRLHPTENSSTFYIACIESIVAVVTEDRVTGWNVRAQEVAWTTHFEGQYVAEGYEPGGARPGYYSYQCNHATANPDVLAVSTTNGPVRVDLRTGAVLPSPEPR